MNHSKNLQAMYQDAFKRVQFLEDLNEQQAKLARNLLRKMGMWQQEFQGQEVMGCLSVLEATRLVALQKQLALTEAIEYIGQFELNLEHKEGALVVLERINQLLVGETIQETIEKG